MVPAHIIESPQLSIGASHNDDALSGNVGGEKLPGLSGLTGAPDRLPIPPKHGFPFELRDPRIHIPRRRNRVRFGKGRTCVVPADNIAQIFAHLPAHYRLK